MSRNRPSDMVTVVIVVLLIGLAVGIFIFAQQADSPATSGDSDQPPQLSITPLEVPGSWGVEGSLGFSRVIDREAGVMCWLAKTTRGVGISCLPFSQTMSRAWR